MSPFKNSCGGQALSVDLPGAVRRGDRHPDGHVPALGPSGKVIRQLRRTQTKSMRKIQPVVGLSLLGQLGWMPAS
jgi:hypothetical protein